MLSATLQIAHDRSASRQGDACYQRDARTRSRTRWRLSTRWRTRCGSHADPLHTALTGEVGTINAVMKYQGYASPQEIYDTNLPIILGVLNNMTKEAKEIEKMNAKIKRK